MLLAFKPDFSSSVFTDEISGMQAKSIAFKVAANISPAFAAGNI